MLTSDEVIPPDASQLVTEAEQARQRAERAEQIQQAAIAQLLIMGMTLEQVAETLGLSRQDIE